MKNNYSEAFRLKVGQGQAVPLIGAYDVFSASLAARYYDGIFLSGFSFAASFYGLPDIGYISWSDIVSFTQRVRAILPNHHIVVDMDDGYCDVEVACHVARLLESSGASAIILEDQKRPRRCGHMEGKQLLKIDEYLLKLQNVLNSVDSLYVVARTDAVEHEDIIRRVHAINDTSADAILVDGIRNIEILKEVRKITTKPLVFNQIYGGKSPRLSLSELTDLGVSIVNYSTPCISSAQSAISSTLEKLRNDDGLLSPELAPGVTLSDCNGLLNQNVKMSRESLVES
ncbi:MAG: isocitrate lyase/PEP mutase family protein [Gammaproteobacteria bacterium]|nr:isocitrate lyase/PEP mutase family protein [Gammaproteobacteria bacterium]